MARSYLLKGFLYIICYVLQILQNLVYAQSLFPDKTSVPIFGHCITPYLERAFCINLEDCTFVYDVLTRSHLKNADMWYLRLSQCGYHNGNILICCPERYRQATTSTPTNVYNMLPQPDQCGKVLSNRIFGGSKTKIDEYPWMALLEYTKANNEKGHHCGGSLINSRYVITASHCVNGKSIPPSWHLTAVRLGEWDTTTNPDCEIDARGEKDCAPEHVDVRIEHAITHPQYNSSSKNQANDIALLRLERNVAYTDFIRPICLPISNNLRSARFDGILMEVAGWGKTEKGSPSDLKLKASVKGYTIDECRSIYMRQNIILEDTQICAGGKNGIDSCRGDSGGPLISLDTKNRVHVYYYLAGIVSFGPTPCGLKGWPGVYTNVGNYIDWILRNIQK